jgi:hypothetical protein
MSKTWNARKIHFLTQPAQPELTQLLRVIRSMSDKVLFLDILLRYHQI